MDDDASPSLITKEEDSSSCTPPSSEESSWISYFVDFIRSETKAHESPCSSFSSVVSSDATTDGGKGNTVADEVTGQNLTKKRTVTRKSVDDDELEDTASSPVNCSPKVLHLKNIEEGSAEKYNSNNKAYGLSCECSPLGKKGLCLVPVSIFHMYKSE